VRIAHDEVRRRRGPVEVAELGDVVRLAADALMALPDWPVVHTAIDAQAPKGCSPSLQAQGTKRPGPKRLDNDRRYILFGPFEDECGNLRGVRASDSDEDRVAHPADFERRCCLGDHPDADVVVVGGVGADVEQVVQADGSCRR
jgi:hypothetical protein